MKLVKMKSRELFDLGIVLIVAAILSIFSISIHSIGKLYSFFNAYTNLPLAEFLINLSFLLLVGLLWITYIRWRKAAKRQVELENIISSISPDVLLVVDPERTIIECNNSLKRMFGYEVDEVIKQKADFLYFDRRSNPEYRHEIHEKLERNGFHIRLATGKKKNGETIPLEIITGNLSDRGGAVQLLRDITERKRAEEVLRESEGRFRRFASAVTDVIYRYNPGNNQYDFISPSFELQTGYSLEEIKADPSGLTRRITHSDDAERVFNEVDNHIKKGPNTGPFCTEYRVIRRDGQVIWVCDRKDIEFTSDGKVYRINGVVRNITDRKRVEEALQRQQKDLQIILDSVPAMIFYKDKQNRLIRVNKALAEATGIAKEKIEGKSCSEVYPNQAENYWRDDKEVMASGKPKRNIIEPMETAKGVRWLQTDKIPYRDEKGDIIGIIGFAVDITERKRAKEKLQESEKKYRTLVETAQEGIGILDPDENIIFVNQAFADLLGYQKDELLSLNLSQISDKEQFAKFKKATEERRQGKSSRYEAKLYTETGEPKYFSLSASPLFDDKGAFTGTMGLLADITERKRAEENLRKAKEEAEEANRLKSEFLANMSHEIRTPMNAIIGMTNLTLDTELTDEQRDYQNTVKESARALLELLNDILDLSKIEADKIELENIDFDLRATIEGLSDTLAHRASTKELELACMIHHQVPALLRGDPGRLRQILMNLGGNAVKFTEKGEVVIRAELLEETEDRATLLFSVTDTGVGIPKDKQSNIFESFIQADGTTTRRYGGTGLGLSISRRLVEMMGGEIGVESEPSKGSRFWFTVTLEKQEELKDDLLQIPADIRGMRMLVVDDNRTNRTILVKMLESFGYCAESAESGAEALHMLKRAAHKEKLFDLVLLDMQMPEMDSEETLRAIKDDPEIKDVVVIILTSIGERGDAARLEALGCAGYLLKPVKQSQLFDAIITVLSRQKTAVEGKSGRIVTRHTIVEQKRRRIRILLAEDNPMNQKLAVALLKKAGYPVDAVETGRMVIEALNCTAYDLILMDVQMPEMDGFEATKAIRQMEGDRKHTPIVAMTARAMKGDQERCLQAGMDDYISKPIEPQELFDTIEKWAKSSVRKKAITGQEGSEKDKLVKYIPIDLETALSRFDGDKKFFREMLQEFLKHAPEQLKTLGDAAKKGNAELVEREAHSIKGAAGNLGAKGIAHLSLKLELLGRTGNLAGAQEMIGNLRTEFEHLEEYIHQWFKVESALKS